MFLLELSCIELDAEVKNQQKHLPNVFIDKYIVHTFTTFQHNICDKTTELRW